MPPVLTKTTAETPSGQSGRLMQRIQPGVMHVDFRACNAYAGGAARAARPCCRLFA